jgi:hypothetical protein
MIYWGWKGRRYQTTTLTSQNVQQKSTNRVNFIGDVRLCELFSRWFQYSINRLVPTLRRRRGIFFLNSNILHQNSIL